MSLRFLRWSFSEPEPSLQSAFCLNFYQLAYAGFVYTGWVRHVGFRLLATLGKALRFAGIKKKIAGF
jgi:hypothetical protein